MVAVAYVLLPVLLFEVGILAGIKRFAVERGKRPRKEKILAGVLIGLSVLILASGVLHVTMLVWWVLDHMTRTVRAVVDDSMLVAYLSAFASVAVLIVLRREERKRRKREKSDSETVTPSTEVST